jgi:hypothetical protein
MKEGERTLSKKKSHFLDFGSVPPLKIHQKSKPEFWEILNWGKSNCFLRKKNRLGNLAKKGIFGK